MTYTKFIQMNPIYAGWSEDKKYHAIQYDGTEVLYRVSEEETYENKRMEFAMMRNVEILGIPICRPIEFGLNEEGVFSIMSWVEGDMAEDTVPAMTESEQYELGLLAGEYLHKIHTIPAPERHDTWEARYGKKMDTRIKSYLDCPVKIKGGQNLLDFVEENRSLIKGRPQCFQHGDYHIGNMMLEDGDLVIIDFDRFDYGDPWEEFNRIPWSAEKSPGFASGLLDGYFKKEIPEEFWKLMALYIACNTLGSVSWARRYGERQVDIIMNQAAKVVEWYKDMTISIPTWYIGAGRKKGTHEITGVKKTESGKHR